MEASTGDSDLGPPPPPADLQQGALTHPAIGDEAAIPLPSLQLNCWACSTLVQVPPLPGQAGQFVNMFKCGWCGAITERSPSRPLSARPRKAASPLWQALDVIQTCLNSARWFLVVLVTALTFSIILPGCLVVLPELHTGWLYWLTEFVAVALSVEVLFNYSAAIVLPAGRVEDCYPLPARDGGTTPPMSFDNFKRCWSCKTFKPPGTHHCRFCGSCIVGMDHHCPFVNNCVGTANLRNFVLFLFWAVAAQAYAIYTAVHLMLRHKEDLHVAWTVAVARARPPLHVLSGMLEGSLTLTAPLFAAAWMVMAASGVLLAVGALLVAQLHNLGSDTTYIQSLQTVMQPPQFSVFKLHAALLQLLGGRHPLLWLWPRWGPALGGNGSPAKRSD